VQLISESEEHMLPLWFCVLQTYQKERGFAPTVPFVFGAICSPTNNIEEVIRNEFAQFVSELCDEVPENFVIKISKCDRLQQPVISPWDSIYRPFGIAIKSSKQGRETLFLDTES